MGFISLLTSAAPTRQSAAEVMRKAAEKLRASHAIEATFTASHAGSTISGEITISGNKFKLTTPELTTWFDGKTQWAYSSSAGEVNISEPTADELSQINPFEVIGNMQKSFTPRRLASPDKIDKIELLPKNNHTEFKKIIISFNASTLLPNEIIFTASDNSVTVISLASVRPVKSLPATTFKFNAKLYPGAEIIDLR